MTAKTIKLNKIIKIWSIEIQFKHATNISPVKNSRNSKKKKRQMKNQQNAYYILGRNFKVIAWGETLVSPTSSAS